MSASYDNQGSQSSFYQRCEYCGHITPGDRLQPDQFSHLRCAECREGLCASCKTTSRESWSNLCVECLQRYGAEALADLFNYALRVQCGVIDAPGVKDMRRVLLGFLQSVVYHEGQVKVIIFVPPNPPEDEDQTVGGWSWVPTDEVWAIEKCGEFSGADPDQFSDEDRERLFAWIESEVEADRMEITLREEEVLVHIHGGEEEYARYVLGGGRHEDDGNEDGDDEGYEGPDEDDPGEGDGVESTDESWEDDGAWEEDWEKAVESGAMSPDEDYCEEDGTIHIRGNSTGPDWNAIDGDGGDAHISRTAESLRALIESLDPDETESEPDRPGPYQADGPKGRDA